MAEAHQKQSITRTTQEKAYTLYKVDARVSTCMSCNISTRKTGFDRPRVVYLLSHDTRSYFAIDFKILTSFYW